MATAIFLDAITAMTFDDAQRILNGSETAATDFFKDKASQPLYNAFRPIIDNTLNQIGTVQTYNAMMAQVRQIPFIKSESLEVGDYVTHTALEGLFHIVADEDICRAPALCRYRIDQRRRFSGRNPPLSRQSRQSL